MSDPDRPGLDLAAIRAKHEQATAEPNSITRLQLLRDLGRDAIPLLLAEVERLREAARGAQATLRDMRMAHTDHEGCESCQGEAADALAALDAALDADIPAWAMPSEQVSEAPPWSDRG